MHLEVMIIDDDFDELAIFEDLSRDFLMIYIICMRKVQKKAFRFWK